jgi:DNA-binding transcriptional regulator YbjK
MIFRRLVRPAQICVSLGVLCLGLASAATCRAADATIVYRKTFPGSSPEFVEIRIGENQGASWDIRQIADPADPEPLEIRAALRAKIFELAAAMHNFEGLQLDVHRRLANLGQKTFRYERGGEIHEATFNYTTDQNANQLLEIFEGLSRQQQDLQAIEHSMKYDRLGVNDALLQFETDLGERSLPEPDCLLPALDQLAADSRFLNIARQRARSLAQRIRSAEDLPLGPPSSQTQQDPQVPQSPANAQNP